MVELISYNSAAPLVSTYTVIEEGDNAIIEFAKLVAEYPQLVDGNQIEGRVIDEDSGILINIGYFLKH